MKALFSIISKELKLLFRDPAGLIMLFILPMIFIFVLSIALNGAFLTSNKNEKLELLIVNNDKGEIGKKLMDGLNGSGYFKTVTALKDRELTAESAKKALAKGEYKIVIVIPEDAVDAVDFKKESKIDIYIDPILSSDFAANITNSVQAFVYLSIINNIEKITDNIFVEAKSQKLDVLRKELSMTEEKKEKLAEELDEFKKQDLSADMKYLIEEISSKNLQELDSKMKELNREIKKSSGAALPEEARSVLIERKNRGLLVNQIYYTESNAGEYFPNSVQQNVPGWTIFALFWIVQTLSLNILFERQSGAFRRILMSPCSTLQYFTGKTVPYFFINIIQAVFMFAIGVFILPFFGCPKLEIKNIAALVLITSGISLASISLGLLFGVISKSMSFAASLSGALLIVMTIFGGIIVPRFIMPDFMQKLSYFVPHGWALDAYQNILVKNYSFMQILPDFFMLLLFALLFFMIALFYFKRSSKRD